MSAASEERLQRALTSLDGLSVGDAFGEQFFRVPAGKFQQMFETRTPPVGPWRFTDDTNMALSIVSILRQHGEIVQDELALNFAQNFDPTRGYGAGMFDLLPKIRTGAAWKPASQRLFGGMGSFGNGSAMRVEPLGAYFADDLSAAVDNARRSAEITHAHSEGIAGAIAVSVASATAWQARKAGENLSRPEFIKRCLPNVPRSTVYYRLELARDLPIGASVAMAVEKLGNGSQVSAQDTVPFVLWCAGENLDNFEEALWRTALGSGDVDTTCAMVGGIVASFTGSEGIPTEWLHAREPLPGWYLEEGGS